MLPAPLRAAGRALARAVTSGAGAGAFALAALFAAELIAGASLQMMGVHDDELQKTLIARYGPAVAAQQAAILAFYLAIGALYGGTVAAALGAWERVRGRPRTRRRRWLLAAAGALAIEGWRLAVAVIRYPQLFVESLYAHGGLRRALQVALTDHVPLAAAEAAGWVALAVLLLGPLATARGRAWLRALPRRRTLAVAAACAIVPAAAAAFAPLRHPRPAAPSDPPNILILAVDSLRADRVGPGHERVAPRLAGLATRGVRFEHAYVTLPRTFPSWVTLLSGRWPHHHGIRHMFPNADDRRAIGPLLPAALAARGYSTAVVSDFAGEIFSRLDAGFQTRRVPSFDLRVIISQAGLNLHPALVPYAASAAGHRVATSLAAAPDNADPDRLADQVIATLREQSARGPFLLTAFFSAPHFPYAAPNPYYRRFTARDYQGRFRYSKPTVGLDGAEGEITDRDVAQVRALYDGAISAVDDAIGRVLDELDRQGLADRTIVVVLADHGENLFEDGRGMGHGDHILGDQALHIPLVVYDPVHKFPAHAVPGLVRDVDLAPTLAALAGARVDHPDGTDLAPLLRGERPDLGLTAYAETELWMVQEGPGFHPDERLPYPPLPALVTATPDDDIVIAPSLRDLVIVAKHRALRTDRWKLHYVPTRAGVRWTLHDLAADPADLVDVAAQHPDVLADLQRRLYRWMTEDGSTVQAGFVVPP
jgi:arylsulfatase A-like enzyme